MKDLHKLMSAAAILGGIAINGCQKSTSPAPIEPTMTPATMPTTMPAAPMATATPMPKLTPPPAKDLTHELAMDEPYFLDEPKAGEKPAGMLKKGSKVLVMIPGAEYSQVTTDTGISAYTPTEGLNPLGK